MMMMMMMMMMMNCCRWMVDRREMLCLISSHDHCHRFSQLQTFNILRSGYECTQYLSSEFSEISCAVVISTTPWQIIAKYLLNKIARHIKRYYWYLNWNLTLVLKSTVSGRNSQMVIKRDDMLIRYKLFVYFM